MEGRGARIPQHRRGILQVAAVEEGGGPGTDGWMHAVLLRQQGHGHTTLVMRRPSAPRKWDGNASHTLHTVPGQLLACL